MKKSCVTCRHTGNLHSNNQLICGLKQLSRCSNNKKYILWESSSKWLIQKGEQLLKDFKKLNSTINSFKNEKQKAIFEKKKQSLIKTIPLEIVNFKFKRDYRYFSKITFHLRWFYTFEYTQKYSESDYSFGGFFCIKCNKKLQFQDLIQAIKVKDIENWNSSNGPRGGMTTTSTDTIWKCPKCKEEYLEFGYVHEEADMDEYDYH